MTSDIDGGERRTCTHVTVLWAEDYPLFETRVPLGEALELGGENQPLAGNLREPWALLDALGRVRIPSGARTTLLARASASSPASGVDASGAHWTLREGDALEVHHEGFCVRLESTRCEEAPGRGPFGAPWDVAALWAVGGSFALHGLFLVMGWLLPPTASALSLDFDRAQLARVRYLLTPTETPVEPAAFMTEAGDAGGESGEPAAGEEGKAGEPEAAKAPRKRQVPRGPAVQNEPAPMDARRAAANVGTLAVLAQVATGLGAGVFDPNAIDPNAEALMGSADGDLGASHGFHGLGMRNPGRGGGGSADGTVKLGGLGTRGGSGGGPGTGVGLPGGRRAGGGPPKLRTHVDVVGSLSKEAIRRTIRRRISEVRYCYEQGLRSRPEMEGRVSVFFLIREDGSVGSSVVKDSSLGHAATDDCIAKAVHRWSFPAPVDGGLVQVTYPFVLQSSP